MNKRITQLLALFLAASAPHCTPHVDAGGTSSMPPDMLRCIPGVSGKGAPSAAEIDSMMEAHQHR